MLEKKRNQVGQKSFQRGSDREDRTLVYRDWLRTIETDGFFLDIDMVKFRFHEGKLFPVAITELTRCDSEDCSEAYRNAIIQRIFQRDAQGEAITSVGNGLGIPIYLVLFPLNVGWLWVFSWRRKEWRRFTPEAWAAFLKNL